MKFSLLTEALSDFEKLENHLRIFGAPEKQASELVKSFKLYKERFKQDRSLNFDVNFWRDKSLDDFLTFIIGLRTRAEKNQTFSKSALI